MSNIMAVHLLFLTFIILAISGDSEADAVPYDHSFTSECLVKPWAPQYGGGIVIDPEFKLRQVGWEQDVRRAEYRISVDLNNYYAAYVVVNQTSYLQSFDLDKDKLYAFSVWVQLKQGRSNVRAVFRAPEANYNYSAGAVLAKEGCWSMLKGGLVVFNSSTHAYLTFEIIDKNDTPTPPPEIWIDSVSLYPFTQQEWNSHRDMTVDKWRKGGVTFRAVDEQGKALVNATLSIHQIQPHFPFGCTINEFILQNPAYANWFLTRGFRYTVFENELKWTTTNPTNPATSTSNYTQADALLQFANHHALIPRAHTVMWGSNTANPPWFNKFTAADKSAIQEAADARINSVMNRYKGQFFQWDIVNENMHHSFLEDTLGPDASTRLYQRAHEIDPDTLPFLNEYHTIERADEDKASPWQFLDRINLMRAQGYTGPLGIGLQSHFSGINTLNLPYVRASIDVLSSAKLPIWVTEMDVSASPNQALYFEEFMREVHAHDAVQGIIIWGGWWPRGGCYKMCLTDDNFKNLPTGDVVDRIMAEWTYGKQVGLKGTTNAGGEYTTLLYHGEYEATITHPAAATMQQQQPPMLQRFKLVPQGQHVTVTFNVI